MKTAPVVAARIEFGDDGVPRAPDFDDVYHPRIGAAAQARHVFLAGNGLPERWRGRERFVILETGFGLGNNFLAAWDAWSSDPQRSERLYFVSIERHPPARDDLARVHAVSPWPDKAAALLAAWPPLTPDLHVVDFDGGRVRLLLAFGDIAAWLPELALRADALFLDGFAPARNPAMWDVHVLKALGRRMAPGATAATWSVARELRDGLTAAGFEVERRPGIGGKREITVALFRPRFTLPAITTPARREALVVGAGLAGASVAQALAEEGWQVGVVDRCAQPAAEASGNPGGLFHGTVHADDGPHARWLRSAALFAQRRLQPLIASGAVAGQQRGLLRLDTRGTAAMQALVDRQRLPPEWLQVLNAEAASRLADVPLPAAAWFYPGGGWAAPQQIVASALQGLRFVGGIDVQALQRAGDGWQLLDAERRVVGEAPVVVLANAGDAARLLGADWPLQRSRGQLSGWSGHPTSLRLPVAGDGYALPLPGGVLCGATHGNGDDEVALRATDEALNFERLQRLTGLQPPVDRNRWFGRVGWRITSADRLPIAGPLPNGDMPARRDAARLWPREPGLFVCTALAGRGITLAPLLGRLLAAQIAGSPWPLPQGLVDAVDPVRWRVRDARRSAASA